MREIIPTIVPLSAEDCAQQVATLAAFSPWIHIDAADGIFAHNTTWLPHEGDILPQGASYEAHLMVNDQLGTGARFARAGAKRIIGHVEAFSDATAIEAAFAAWKAAGATEVGVAIKVDTPIEALDAPLLHCDCVVLMTIAEIGRQGEPFDPRAQARIAEFARLHPEAIIMADGGMNEGSIPPLAKAGVSRFCVGSTIASAPDKAGVYKHLAEIANAV